MITKKKGILVTWYSEQFSRGPAAVTIPLSMAVAV